MSWMLGALAAAQRLLNIFLLLKDLACEIEIDERHLSFLEGACGWLEERIRRRAGSKMRIVAVEVLRGEPHASVHPDIEAVDPRMSEIRHFSAHTLQGSGPSARGRGAMSPLHTREQQLAKRRADRELDIDAESELVSRSASCVVLVERMGALFETPRRFSDRHAVIGPLIDLVRARREAGELLVVTGFRVPEESLPSTDLSGDAPEPVLGPISDGPRRPTARTSRMRGDRRGARHLSGKWRLCNVCGGRAADVDRSEGRHGTGMGDSDLRPGEPAWTCRGDSRLREAASTRPDRTAPQAPGNFRKERPPCLASEAKRASNVAQRNARRRSSGSGWG